MGDRSSAQAPVRSKAEAIDEVHHLLEEAAAIWVRHVCQPQGTAPSGGNPFLWIAEDHWAAAAAAHDPEPPDDGFYLYRLWGETGRLIYVGVSVRLRQRLATHRRRWGQHWDTATWEQYPDAASMLAAERDAIQRENPAFNKAHA